MFVLFTYLIDSDDDKNTPIMVKVMMRIAKMRDRDKITVRLLKNMVGFVMLALKADWCSLTKQKIIRFS